LLEMVGRYGIVKYRTNSWFRTSDGLSRTRVMFRGACSLRLVRIDILVAYTGGWSWITFNFWKPQWLIVAQIGRSYRRILNARRRKRYQTNREIMLDMMHVSEIQVRGVTGR
jgi:hypothetical protein